MSVQEDDRHVVPCYRAVEGEAWFHFLHGDVPRHAIDFIYRPEVPQGNLTRQHYSHLARLMRYIEPQEGADHAFVIGNLSRDDTQHEPGHGGLALILGLRIQGACDPTGRPDPAFTHAIAAVDHPLDADALFDAATAFHEMVVDDGASASWYRSYARVAAREPPASLALFLAGYVAAFRELPRPQPIIMKPAWTAGGAAPAGRLVFVHPDDTPFAVVARAATRLAAVLYRSDVRWTAISTGREADLPDGLSVRFVAESAVGAGEQAATLRPISAIPEDEEAIARELLGAWATQGLRPVAVGRPRSFPPAEAADPRQSPAPARPASVPPAASATQSTPLPLAPIPVPLPLVSPPPLPKDLAAPPPAPRRSAAGIVAACLTLALAASIWVLFAQAERPPMPEAAAPPATAASPVPVTMPEAPAPADPPTPEAAEPAPEPPPPAEPPPEAHVARAHPPPPALPRPVVSRSSARCGVLDGKPCF